MKPLKRMIAPLATAVAVSLTGLVFAATAQAAPYVTAPSVSVSTTTPAVGGTLTISASGFAPNTTVDITLHSQVYNLGTATTDASGSLSTTVTLPAGVSGNHTIVMTDPASGQSVSLAVDIGGAAPGVGAPVGGAPVGAPPGAGAPPGTGTGGIAFTGVAAIGLGALGAALLVGGGVLLMAGRRRKVRA